MARILQLIATRIALAVVTLFAVSALVFVLASVLPGDVAAQVLGKDSTAAQRQEFRQAHGLDRPLIDRYGTWLDDAVQGNFGTSYESNSSVGPLIGSSLGNTVQLAAYALVISLVFSALAAIVGAVFRGRWPDSVVSTATLAGLALPEFVLGPILIVIFSVALSLFPALSVVPPGAGVGERLRVLTLPAVTVALTMSTYVIRMLRESLIEALDSEYVRSALLRGLPRGRVIFRHALLNALGPALNVVALNFTYMIGGLVVVETVFSYPGIGSVLVNAISNQDTPVVEAIVLIASAFYIAANLVADVLALLLNPKLRTA